MGWIVGVCIFAACSGLVVWANKRFWDRVKATPHNNIKGLDY